MSVISILAVTFLAVVFIVDAIRIVQLVRKRKKSRNNSLTV